MSRKEKLIAYLVAHTDKGGHNAAQTTISAVNKTEMMKAFRIQFPERDVLSIGIEGEEG